MPSLIEVPAPGLHTEAVLAEAVKVLAEIVELCCPAPDGRWWCASCGRRAASPAELHSGPGHESGCDAWRLHRLGAELAVVAKGAGATAGRLYLAREVLEEVARALDGVESWPLGDQLRDRLLGIVLLCVPHRGYACRICGCTEHDACEGGCSWVEADLCSACVPASTAGAELEGWSCAWGRDEATWTRHRVCAERGELREEWLVPLSARGVCTALERLHGIGGGLGEALELGWAPGEPPRGLYILRIVRDDLVDDWTIGDLPPALRADAVELVGLAGAA